MAKLISKKKVFENMLVTKQLSEQRIATINLIIANVIDEIEILKPRIDEAEYQAYIRGLEKQPGAPNKAEGNDKEGSSNEDGNM